MSGSLKPCGTTAHDLSSLFLEVIEILREAQKVFGEALDALSREAPDRAAVEQLRLSAARHAEMTRELQQMMAGLPTKEVMEGELDNLCRSFESMQCQVSTALQ